jgi:hypothetical protein
MAAADTAASLGENVGKDDLYGDADLGCSATACVGFRSPISIRATSAGDTPSRRARSR